MTTDLIKLGLVFVIIILLTWRKLGLDLAMLGGTLATILLYFLPPKDVVTVSFQALISRATIEMIAAFYLITFVQRVLQSRQRLRQAEEAVSQLFQSRRMNAMIIPFVIGFLPSPGAVLLAAPIVRNASGSSLTVPEQAFVTSYYRHIPEAFLPTYTSILLALQLSNQSMSGYILGMLPLVIVLFGLGYVFYVRKIPVSQLPAADSKWQVIKQIGQGLWPILLAVLIILVFELPVWLTVLIVIGLQLIVERVKLAELPVLARASIEPRVLSMIAIVMVFKAILEQTGAVERIAASVATVNLSPVVIFGLIFFLASLMIGSSGTIAIFMPMAFAAIPGAGIPHLILFMAMEYIAMQVAPTHICLGIAVNEFDISLDQLIRKTMPILVVFIVISILYYQVLTFL